MLFFEHLKVLNFSSTVVDCVTKVWTQSTVGESCHSLIDANSVCQSFGFSLAFVRYDSAGLVTNRLKTAMRGFCGNGLFHIIAKIYVFMSSMHCLTSSTHFLWTFWYCFSVVSSWYKRYTFLRLTILTVSSSVPVVTITPWFYIRLQTTFKVTQTIFRNLMRIGRFEESCSFSPSVNVTTQPEVYNMWHKYLTFLIDNQ